MGAGQEGRWLQLFPGPISQASLGWSQSPLEAAQGHSSQMFLEGWRRDSHCFCSWEAVAQGKQDPSPRACPAAAQTPAAVGFLKCASSTGRSLPEYLLCAGHRAHLEAQGWSDSP